MVPGGEALLSLKFKGLLVGGTLRRPTIFQRLAWGSVPLSVAIALAVTAIGIAGRAANPAFVNDQLEMLVFSAEWRWIYDEQMPVYAWIAKALLDTTGQSVIALDLLKYAFVGGMIMALAASANRVKAGTGTLAIGLAFLLPTVNDDLLSEVTHTAALMAATATSVWLIVRALSGERQRLWLWLALAWALGLAFKHTMFLVAIAQIGAVAMTPAPGRGTMIRHMAAAGALMLLACSPLLLLLASHADTVQTGLGEFYRLERSTGAALRDLISSPLAEGGLLAAVVAIAWMRSDRPSTAPERVLIAATAIFLVLMAAGVLVSGADVVRDRWLAPGLLMLAPAGAMMITPRKQWQRTAFASVCCLAAWRAIETAGLV